MCIQSYYFLHANQENFDNIFIGLNRSQPTSFKLLNRSRKRFCISIVVAKICAL